MIRYTPQVTHIVSDPDVDEPAFLKFLGVASREELSETVRDRGVSYEWVSTCIRVSFGFGLFVGAWRSKDCSGISASRVV